MEELKEVEFIDTIIIKRTEHNDIDIVEQLTASQFNKDILHSLYSFESLSKLAETSLISLTICDSTDTPIGLIVFDDYPQYLVTKTDYLHYNLWENWLYDNFNLEQITNPFNTVWLTFYFLDKSKIENCSQDQEMEILTKAFREVYKYYVHIELIGFHLCGQGLSNRYAMNEISKMLDHIFIESMRKSQTEVSHDSAKYSKESRIFLSPRFHLVEVLEVRNAKQQDHDDLAAIFNQQSDVPTEKYGEFFIAELIAAQNEDRKAIVAQVGAKAVGLMSVTKDIDYSILAKNFELDIYDNLLKNEYVEAFKYRKTEIDTEKKLKEVLEDRKIQKLIKHEVAKTRDVGQRMALQQHLLNNEINIRQDLDKIKSMKDDDKKKQIHKDYIQNVFKTWLTGYSLYVPSDLLIRKKYYDDDFYCSILTEQEYMLNTLTFFGLPKNYMEGEGHWKDWERKKMEEKKNEQARKNFSGIKNQRRRRKKEEENLDDMKPPIWFDIEPLEKALYKFLLVSADMRANFFRKFVDNSKKIYSQLFCLENGEPIYTRCQDINDFGQALDEKKIHKFGEAVNEIIGPYLVCFGGIEYDQEIIKVEEKLKEEAKDAGKEKESKKKNLKHAVDQAEKKVEPPEIRYVDKIIQRVTWADLQVCIKKLWQHDLILQELGLVTSPILEEEVNYIKEQDAIEEAKIKESHYLEPCKLDAYDSIKNHDNFEELPEVPIEYHNAVCINIFCIDELYETRSLDFLPFVFNLFPDKDYIILTQPHIVEETQLLQHFIQVPKKKNVNFDHVLYIYHKANLMSPSIYIRRSIIEDISDGMYLFKGIIESETTIKQFKESITNLQSNNWSYSVYLDDQIIGLYLISKDANIDYYQSHFSIQYHMLLDAYSYDSYARLLHSLINPIFQKHRKFVLKEIMRISNKKVFFFEIKDKTILPDVYSDLIPVRHLRFPNFLDRIWDHDWSQEYKDRVRRPASIQDQDRDPFDQVEGTFALSMITKSMIAINKIVNNTRIVVVGASDTGISFLETLLTMKYVHYPYLYLLAPGGLTYMHLQNEHHLLKSISPYYTINELKNLMIDAQVTLIDAKMEKFDRKTKQIFLETKSRQQQKIVNYDLLVLAVGFIDRTKNELKRVYTKYENGVNGSHAEFEEDLEDYEDESNMKTEERMIIPPQAQHIYSIDNENLYKLFEKGSGGPYDFITHKKRPQNILIIGRNLNAISFCCGLMQRGVKPHQIYIAMPKKNWLEKTEFQSNEERNEWEDNKMQDPDAFEDSFVHEKIIGLLRDAGVHLYENSLLWDVKLGPDDVIKTVVIKNRVTDNEEELNCSVIVTSYIRDIEPNLFKTVQDNGLVYNGRLIVKNNFQTTDNFIFAGGKICEFSMRYKNFTLGRSLRMDKYSSREVGQRMARCVLECMNIMYPPQPNSPEYEELPIFHLPIGEGSYLLNNLIYFHVVTVDKTLPRRMIESETNREEIVSKNFDGNNEHNHYLRFIFDNYGLVQRAFYLGDEKIRIPSLSMFIGLSETYFNKLTDRFKSGLVKNVTEFLSENWAIALYHEWFSEFRFNVKNKIAQEGEMKKLLGILTNDNGSGFLTRDIYKNYKSKSSEEAKKLIKAELLSFIKKNPFHLPMYFSPESKIH